MIPGASLAPMSDHVYIFPTDTVWGLGAALTSTVARERIATIKRITHPRPYALIFARPQDLQTWLQIPAPWADLDWPQILAQQTTVLFPKVWLVAAAAVAAPTSSYVGVRWQPWAPLFEIWQQEQVPLISTSLNLTGENPITDEAAAQAFQQKYAPDAIFKGGAVNLAGRPSTILALDPPADSASRLALRVLRGPLATPLAARLRSMGLNINGD